MKGSRFRRGFVSLTAAALMMGLVGAAPAGAAKKPPTPPSPETTVSKVQFSSATYTRSEAGGLAVVSIKRSSKKGTASVAVSATDNTATAGADYGPWNGSSSTGLVTFASGQTTKTLNIPIFQDGFFEGPEIVNLTLGPEVTNVQLGQSQQAELTIVDDEVASVSIADVAPVGEGEAAVYTVSLAVSAGATRVVPVQVGWEVVYGGASAADFTPPVSGQVAIPTDASSATFAVQSVEDAQDEPELESFMVRLTGASAEAGIGDGSATGGIVDDDDPPLITLGDAAPAGEGGDLAFSVNLGAPSGLDVTAELELWTPGAQYPAVAYAEAEDVVPPASPSVTIPAGASSVPFVVGTVDDALYEGDESFGVHVVGATNAALPADDLGGASQADRWAYGTIGDNELPAVCVFDAFEPNDAPLLLTTPLAAGTYPSLTLCPDEGGHPMWVGADWYPIDVNAGDTIEVTVDFLHAEGNIFLGLADFNDPDESPGDHGFSDGTGDQEHIVAVAPFTGRYYILVGLDVDAGTIPGNAYTLTFTVTPAPPTLSLAAPAAAVEGPDAVEFTVGLGPGVLPFGVVVYWDMTAGGDEVAVASGEVTLPAGSSTAVISLSPVDDEIYEIDSPLTVRLLETSGHEVNPAASTATVMLADDDALTVTLSGPATVAEGAMGTYTVHLDRFSEVDFPLGWEVALETAGPADVNSGSGVVTVPAGTQSLTLDVATVDDGDEEADETFTVRITSLPPPVTAGDPYQVAVTIPANDAPVCVDDSHEDNDNFFFNAPVLAEGSHDLTLCAGDYGATGLPIAGEDWFIVNLNAGDTVDLTASFLPAEGNVDLFLYSPVEMAFLIGAENTGSPEHIRWVATETGGHLLFVMLVADAGTLPGTAYTLTIAVTPAAPACADDVYEDNDGRATAADIPVEFVIPAENRIPLQLCPGDGGLSGVGLANDWFRFEAPADAAIVVEFSFPPDEGDVVVSLEAPDGSTIGTSSGEPIMVLRSQAGEHFVSVRLDSDAGAVGAPYELSVSVLVP